MENKNSDVRIEDLLRSDEMESCLPNSRYAKSDRYPGTLEEMCSYRIDMLQSREYGVEHPCSITENSSPEDATHYVVTSLRKTKRRRKHVNCPQDVFRLIHKDYENEYREVFRAVYLNTKHYVIAVDIISIGSLDACIVHPREILRPAISQSASCMVLVHNHPSGDPTPSGEDTEFTQRMYECGQLIGVELLDHIILGDGSFTSLKERGDF